MKYRFVKIENDNKIYEVISEIFFGTCMLGYFKNFVMLRDGNNSIYKVEVDKLVKDITINEEL